MFSLLRKLRKVKRDDHGTAAIEFALTFPMIATLSMGVFEFGFIMLTDSLMEGGLKEASRYGITGREIAGVTRTAEIINIVDKVTLGFVDMSKVDLQILTYPSFGDVGKGESFVDGNANGVYDEGETFSDANGNGAWDNDMGTASSGGAGAIVVYKMTYDWEIITPFMGDVIGTNGKFPIKASIVVRNEPWEDEGS